MVKLQVWDGTATDCRDSNQGWQLYAGSRTELLGNPAYPKVSRAQPPLHQTTSTEALRFKPVDYAPSRLKGRDSPVTEFAATDKG
ncbi:hypothetical protein D3C87_1715290 [compost metagenome]